MPSNPSDLPIETLLASLGLTGEPATRARATLEEAGVTNPRKQRIASTKLDRARAVIDGRWLRVCHNCASRAVTDARELVFVPPSACTVCGGSSNARAVDGMVAACRSAGVRRLVMVGGSPDVRRELQRLVGAALDLRLVDGTRKPDRRSAQSNIAWADLIVVLGSSELAHKVSTLYTKDSDTRRKLITTGRRGIEAIADDIARSDVVTGVRR